MICYFPSCNFTSLRPETSARIKAFMHSCGVTVKGCCRPGHKEVEAGDMLITICKTCRIICEENRPDTVVVSLAEWLDSLKDFVFPDYHGERITLQDCYRAKGRAGELLAVRSVLKKMNFEVVELPQEEETVNFDGDFCFRPVAARNIAIAPKTFAAIERDLTPKSPDEADSYLRQYCKRFTTKRVIC